MEKFVGTVIVRTKPRVKKVTSGVFGYAEAIEDTSYMNSPIHLVCVKGHHAYYRTDYSNDLQLLAAHWCDDNWEQVDQDYAQKFVAKLVENVKTKK